MFNQSVDQRLAEWINCRSMIDQVDDPLQFVWDFWHQAPFVPYNKNVNPYCEKYWPSPWEIIAENKYDDFTRALMIAWTLKLTKKFNNSKIEIKILVDSSTEREYNVILVDDKWVINYSDDGPVPTEKLNNSFKMKTIIEVHHPR